MRNGDHGLLGTEQRLSVEYLDETVVRQEADGFVERMVDPNDRRNVRAALTESGRRAFERASAILAEHERAIDERLGQAPRAELARGLQTMREG